MADLPKRVGVVAGVTGAYIVLRDETGRIVEKAAAPKSNAPVHVNKSWRSLLSKLTNNGLEQFSILRELSLGTPFSVTLPDGTVSEPTLPSAETRRAASRDLLEFLHGRPVTQTEVAHAEAESRLLEQVQALSDEELMARVRAQLGGDDEIDVTSS